jgi:hypothetical protein
MLLLLVARRRLALYRAEKGIPNGYPRQRKGAELADDRRRGTRAVGMPEEISRQNDPVDPVSKDQPRKRADDREWRP